VSSAAVNPTLTIIANALRVGDHLMERFGANAATDTRQQSTNARAAAELVMAK
jgi:hypothetical protein